MDEKPKLDAVLILKISSDMKKELEALARKYHRNASEQVRYLIAKAVEESS